MSVMGEFWTVNRYYYKEVLIKLRERKNYQNCGKMVLYQDNASTQTTLSVKQFLGDKHITTLEHPPYLPDLEPCDSILFFKLKFVLKGINFEVS